MNKTAFLGKALGGGVGKAFSYVFGGPQYSFKSNMVRGGLSSLALGGIPHSKVNPLHGSKIKQGSAFKVVDALPKTGGLSGMSIKPFSIGAKKTNGGLGAIKPLSIKMTGTAKALRPKSFAPKSALGVIAPKSV